MLKKNIIMLKLIRYVGPFATLVPDERLHLKMKIVE
jgi:hypothetical protein